MADPAVDGDYLIHAWQRLFQGESPDRVQLNHFLGDVMAVSGWNYDDKAAKEWGNGFRLPKDVGARDMSLFTCHHHDIEKAVTALRQTTRHDRLSHSRVSNCVPVDDPDYERIVELATVGIRVHTSIDFQPNRSPPKLRQLYVQTSGAVDRMLYELHQDNLLFILPLWYVRLHLSSSIHFSPLHWAKKSGKPCGRPIFDASDDKYGALNSEDATSQAEEHYGAIHHPTITDIILMILDFQESMQHQFLTLFDQSQLILFKHDLSRAFMLLDFAATDVPMLAALMTDEQVALHHTGVFGLGGMPFAFQVVTRVIQRHLNHPNTLLGKVRMYVDDIIGVTLRSFVSKDNHTVVEYCEQLLGPDAIAADKSEVGRRLNVLGYVVDLNSQRVGISQRNLFKFAHHLFTVDLDARVSVTKLQQLASLSSRYASVLPCMKPFASALYGNFAGVRNVKALQVWHPAAIVAVQLWKVVLVHLHFNEDTFARPFTSFRRQHPSYVLTFDASLTGCGFVLREFVGATTTDDGRSIIHDTGAVVSVGKLMFATLPTPLLFGNDSKYQNTAEFIAVVFAIACLSERGIQHTGLALRGDSSTALAWCITERFRTVFAKPAALVFLLLCLEEGLDVSMTEHISAEHNTVCDGLSRAASVSETCKHIGVCSSAVTATLTGRVMTIVSSCNSDVELEDFDKVVNFWKRVNEEVSHSH